MVVTERLEVDISVKNNIKPWLDKVRDDISWFNKRIKTQTAIDLSIKSASIKKELDNVRDLIKKAKKSWDFDAEIKLTADSKILRNQLTQADRELRNFLRTWQKDVSVLWWLFDRVKTKVSDFVKVFVAGLAIDQVKQFWIESFKAFTAFEKWLANINTVARVSQKELNWLWEEIKKVAETYWIAKDELLQTSFNIASAWVEFNNITEILELSSRTALAAWTDTTTAFNWIIAVVKKYWLDLTESTKIADLFFKTNELWQTTVNDLAQAITNLSTTAPLAWVSLTDLFWVYSTLTWVTWDANQVTTQLNWAINALAAPTTEASAKFKELWIEVWSAAIEQKWLAWISKEIYEATNWNLEVLRKLIPEVEATKLVIALATTQYDKFKKSTDELANSQGSLWIALEEITNTTSFKLAIQQQKWDNFKIKVWWIIKNIWWFLFDLWSVLKSVFFIFWAILTQWLNTFIWFWNWIDAWITDITKILKNFAETIPKIFKAALNWLPAIFAKAFNDISKTLLWNKLWKKVWKALWLEDLVATDVFWWIKMPEIDFKDFKSSVDSSINISQKLNKWISDEFENIKKTISWKWIKKEVFDKIIIDSQKFWSDLIKTTKSNSAALDKIIWWSSSWEKAIKEKEKLQKEQDKKDLERFKRLQKRFKTKTENEVKIAELAQKEIDWNIEDSEKAIKSYQDEIEKTWESFKTLKEKAISEMSDIDDELLKLDIEKSSSIANRVVQIQEEIKVIKEKDKLEWDDLLVLKDLEEELRLAKENTTKTEIDNAERISKLSKTELILEEIEAEKQKLIEKKLVIEQDLILAEDKKNKEIEILQSKIESEKILIEWLWEIRIKTEEFVTKRLNEEANKQIAITDKVIDKVKELIELKRQAWLENSLINTDIPTGTDNNTSNSTDNSSINVNLWWVNVNNNADIQDLADKIARVIVTQKKTNQ